MKDRINNLFLVLWITLISLMCVVPMGLSPIWNGEIPGHRNQYELMAEALINGHLYLDVDVSNELKEMTNPYDAELREKLGVEFHHDHAYYDGKYYMYFGVVPVIVLFLPFRLLTGHALTTYHATQIFVTLFIFGIFALFAFLRKRFFNAPTSGIYALLGGAFSIMSVWYCVIAPALYCTAISAGICTMIWSLYFYSRAVFDGYLSMSRKLLFFIIGAFLGALCFGCRPPIALANIMVFPLFVIFLYYNKDVSKKTVIQIALSILIPYLIIGILLAIYNYARFDSVIEFGQRYQLTVEDQSDYGLNRLGIIRLINGFNDSFFVSHGLTREFPYVTYGSIFSEFPVLLWGIGGLVFSRSLRVQLQEKKLLTFIYSVCFSIFLIVALDIIMAPYIIQRYQLDVLFLMAIITYLVVMQVFEDCYKRHDGFRMKIVIIAVSIITIITTMLLLFVPAASNYMSYYPDKLEKIRNMFKVLDNLL